MKNMNQNKLREAIMFAQEAVKDIKDRDLKLKTYEIVLNNFFKTNNAKERIEDAQDNKVVVSNYVADKNNIVQKIAKACNLSEEQVEDIVEINGENISLLISFKKLDTVPQQVTFLLIYLAIKKIVFDEKEVESSKLRELLASKQISLSNLSTHIKKYSSYIIHKTGKKGSTNTQYRITNEGYARALQLLELLSDDLNLTYEKIKEIIPVLKKRKTSSINKEILKLVDEGFFDTPKPTNDAVAVLKSRGFFNRRQDVDAYIRKVLLGEKLIREKINKKWHYVTKK